MGDATEHLAKRLGIEPDEIVELSSIRIPIRPHLRVREDGQVEHVDAYMREITSMADLTEDERKAIGYEGEVQAARNLAERRRSDEFSARRARDREVAAFEKQMKRTGRATPRLQPGSREAREAASKADLRNRGTTLKGGGFVPRNDAERARMAEVEPNPPPSLDEPGARDADWAARAQQVDYDTAEALLNTGQWSAPQFEAYQHLWATSAFRYSSVAQPVVPYEDLPDGVRRYVDMVKPPTAIEPGAEVTIRVPGMEHLSEQGTVLRTLPNGKVEVQAAADPPGATRVVDARNLLPGGLIENIPTAPTAVENLESKLDIPNHSTRPVPLRMYKKGTVAQDADGHDVVLGPDGVWRHVPDPQQTEIDAKAENMVQRSGDGWAAVSEVEGFYGTQRDSKEAALDDAYDYLESDEADDNPWGEQQSQIDYLETRYDYPPDEP